MEKAHSPKSERDRRSSISPAISIGSNTPPPTSSAGTSTSDLYHKDRERPSPFNRSNSGGSPGMGSGNGNTKPTDDRLRTKSPNYPAYSTSSSSLGLNGDHNNKASSNDRSSPGGASPSTKNVGVGANLNISVGRHSSAPVSVGHGLFGSINGPSSVSISTGLNPIVSITSPPLNNGTGAGATHTTSNTTISFRHPLRDRERNSSISPGLVPNSILPELLHHAQAQLAANASVGGSSSTNSPRGAGLSTSSSSTSGAGQSVGGTKVGPTSPTKQGILGRSGRGEMINGSTSSTNTTLNHNAPAAQASKIVSQNVNGTLALTSIPSNESELQLFRVLQRANLLSYFDVMIELGGDDVQQLCEAGEEEFLEIMALIGMASKPLHVRRLQKALQEWMTNPSVFQSPVLPPGVGPQATGGGRPAIPAIASSISPPVAPVVIPIPPVATTASGVPALPAISVTTTPPSGIPAPNVSTGNANSSTNSATLPIRPIPGYHSVPSAAAAMAAAAVAAQQAMFLSPSEMKSLQNKLHVMTNGHHHLLGGSAGNSPNNGVDRISSSTGNNLTVRTTHLSPSSPGGHGGAPTSFSNGYHHHPSRNGHERILNAHHSDRHHESSRDKDSYFSDKLLHSSLSNGAGLRIHADQIIPSHFLEQRIRTGSEPCSPAASDSPSESGSSLSPVPFLQEAEIMKLADAALQIVKSLPPYVFEPQLPPKKKFFGDFELIMRLSPSDPRRTEEIRKASTIYGRPDPSLGNMALTKSRKFPKPLSINEVCVNEAAAQLCRHVPALLTRREELFALAKQVVRDASLPYTNTNNFSISLSYNNNNNNIYANANHNNMKHKSSAISTSSASSSHNQIELSSSNNSISSMGSNHNHTNGDHLHHYRQDRDHHGRSDHRHQDREQHNQHNNNHSSERSNGDYMPLTKRLRLDASGMEIQEYNRPPSNTSEPSQDGSGIQITPIRNLQRRSPSEDHHSPLPIELVTVTSSSPQRSSESGSPPVSLRRSLESEDLMNFKLGNVSAPSIKITSIPVSGGCINISHDQSITGTSGPLKLLPIKTEPAN